MKSLFITLSFIIAGMIFYPTSASSTIQSSYLNGSSESDNPQGKSTEIDQYSKAGVSKFENMISKSNLNSTPRFNSTNQSGLLSIGLPSHWNNQFMSCMSYFKCTANFSTGWKDDTSFQVSTANNTSHHWSWIFGAEKDVAPTGRYVLVTHMKLNEWATQSHIVLEGFNETSKRWHQIGQCPSGTNGPLEWKEFRCVITIPENITKLKPALNSGWSSQPKQEATTWFDNIYMMKFTSFVTDQ